MGDKQVTQSDVQNLRYIQQNEQQLNEFFRQMQFKKKDFQLTNPQQPKKPQTPKPKLPNYSKNYRGEKIFAIEDLRKKYENAFFGTKWFTLPYCRRTIFGKIQFWCGASFIFTYMWASYYMRKNELNKVHWKFYRNTYAAFALGFSAFVFLESMFFEPYCNINSYHYKPNDNLFVARDIKKQLREINK